jgi:hypothetical protein
LRRGGLVWKRLLKSSTEKKITGNRNSTAAKYIGMPVSTISGVTSR